MVTVTEDFPRFQLVKLSGLIFFPNSLALLRVDLTKSKDTQRVGNEWSLCLPGAADLLRNNSLGIRINTSPLPSTVTKRAPRGGAALSQGESWCCLTLSRHSSAPQHFLWQLHQEKKPHTWPSFLGSCGISRSTHSMVRKSST